MKHVSPNIFRWLSAFVAVCALSLPGVFAQGKQDFTLVNETGVVINSVYISPHSVNAWEEDILGQAKLDDGESVDITFSRKEKAAKWDLRIEDSDGNAIEWESLNLLQISKLTLHYKNGKSWADAE